MEQSQSWERNGCSAWQEVPRLSRYPRERYSGHTSTREPDAAITQF